MMVWMLTIRSSGICNSRETDGSRCTYPYVIDERGRVSRYSLKRYLCYHYVGTGNCPMMHFAMHFQRSDDQ